MKRAYLRFLIPLALFTALNFYLIIYVVREKTKPVQRLRAGARSFDLYQCPADSYNSGHDNTPQLNYAYGSSWNGSTENRVLLIAETESTYNRQIAKFIRFFKIPVRVETLDNEELVLQLRRGRFSLIVFESYKRFAGLNEKNRAELLNYCRFFNVGIVSFMTSSKLAPVSLSDQNVTVSAFQRIVRLSFDETSKLAYISRPGVEIVVDEKDTPNWNLFYLQNKTVWKPFVKCVDYNLDPAAVVIHDNGSVSGVEHVVFGQQLGSHFFMKLAFWDVVAYMLRGAYPASTERYLQIDIDDVFVGQPGTRLVSSDVDALIKSQSFIRQYVENFTYTLGFSGYFFRRGDSEENVADEVIVRQASNFYWFPHMWHHNHAQEFELTYLIALMTQNELFAKNFKLRMLDSYAVAPQHGGVYPVHQALYDAWKTVWNVTVTSTEEYPHFAPEWNRRAFSHSGIRVLPRQTCGLFTHTHYFHAYPDGFSQLEKSIFGGNLVATFLQNPFLIFMTHSQNYGNDRLAHYTFHNELRFLTCWTRMKFKWTTPDKMADLHFSRFPGEERMVHTNPCDDARHKKMLSVNETCPANERLPNVIIVGPQKTGTSALLAFLRLHPNITANDNIEKSFEETQFFGGYHYEKGIRWYKEKFAHATPAHSVVVEKTANYFDNPQTPDLLSAAIPDAKIVIMLLDPTDRAYSWYRHMRAHNDSIALKFTAEELFSMTPDHAEYNATSRLRQRCLKPGHYAEHIDRWLDYFPPSSLVFVDALDFRSTPVSTLNDLIARLELPTDGVDYSRHIRYVASKGFYCAVINGKTKCLGASKGRKYSPPSEDLRRILNSYYAIYNRSLVKMLKRYKFTLPNWLLRSVAPSN